APVIPGSAAKLLDAMGVPADARGFAALEDPDSYARLVASGFRLALPTPIFPRLEMPGEE
ncbi:MAG: methionine--tRNA ligase, partial [Allosphingosinicella sp.]